MKNLTLLAAGLLFTMQVFAQQASYELTCRSKAKEIAADTYRNCVSENKAAEIDRLKKSYQEKIKLLKEEYEAEVTKMGLQKNKKAAVSTTRKTAPTTSVQTDDSQMDIPEPIPVELNNSNSGTQSL